MTVKKVFFYNKGHIGDLHLTRQYVKAFPKWFPKYQFGYIHAGHPVILSDTEVPMLNLPDLLKQLPHDSSGIVDEEENIIYLNTWVYACGNISFCTFQSGQEVMKKYFGFLKENAKDKSEIPHFAFPVIEPQIDYKKAYVDTENIDSFFEELKKENDGFDVFFCNNYTQNNQSYNDNLNFFALRLAKEFNARIWLTNRIPPLLSPSPKKQVFYIENILGIENRPSLNELSYFSTKCDIIIGRGSGPFTYAEVKENLNKTWFSMTFPHVACDMFNGLHNYKNNGNYFHTQDEDVIISEIRKKI